MIKEEMGKTKKLIRHNFRTQVFERDNYKCVICDNPAQDAHHITNRNEMPNGGYVKENGISLCEDCHRFIGVENIEGIFQKAS